MHGCSRMAIESRIPTLPGRSMSGFHRQGRYCLHQARSAVRSTIQGFRKNLPAAEVRTVSSTYRRVLKSTAERVLCSATRLEVKRIKYNSLRWPNRWRYHVRVFGDNSFASPPWTPPTPKAGADFLVASLTASRGAIHDPRPQQRRQTMPTRITGCK